jgi:hypothetical protein
MNMINDNEMMIIIRTILTIFVIFWSVLLLYIFKNSWKIIPINKTKARFYGQLCLIITHIILIISMLSQIYFEMSISNFSFWSLQIAALLFFLLWILGFGLIEKREIERVIKKEKLKRLKEKELERIMWVPNETTKSL